MTISLFTFTLKFLLYSNETPIKINLHAEAAETCFLPQGCERLGQVDRSSDNINAFKNNYDWNTDNFLIRELALLSLN